MFGELNNQEIENVLKSQIIGRLACYADGVVYVVPISYAYDGEYIYARALEGMKIEMMRKNPKVCFQTDKMENLANWESIVVWGDFEELKSDSERDHAIKTLMERVLPLISSETMHLSPHWPFPTEETGNIEGILFRIKVEKKTGRFEKSAAKRFYAS
ncbi:MAG: pyridoxamine 5'-phosphate oxidase [Sphingobacteriales bacterium UTBCD1]|jgi:nitroimidazol reductase NimA-like FMN-containing flavoprotein (pyridoxamine 5'-phosphate oxidase superfamily)|nr:MAG: pyridoxamine 5'-phosphate oxidase [Sphingobacteriales bacterium UTBCD1]